MNIEDNEANVNLIKNVFNKEGFITLYIESDAYSGFGMPRSILTNFILLDINFPGMNGYQVMKALSKDSLARHMSVVAVSANAMVSDVEKAKDAGFAKYITKPINVSDFLNDIYEVLYH